MSRIVLRARDDQHNDGMRPAAGEAVWIAIDLSRSKWVYCVRWGAQEQRRLSSPAGLEHLQALVDQYRDQRVTVVYEACGFGYEIVWFLQARKIEVIVVAPCKVERAPGRRVKTDRLDAATLARKLEQGQLKKIYVPPREIHEQRQAVRAYLQARKDRRRQQTRIRSLLQEHARLGPEPSRGWSVYAKWLAQQSLPVALSRCVEELLSLRQSADICARRLKADLLNYARLPHYAPIVNAITQQPGVGPFSAIWIVLELADIHRFRSGRALVHYLGLVPKEESSGEIVRRGHILKCGPATLRSLLLQCAWRSIRVDQGDPALRGHYQRLRTRLESKRAIIAVARCLTLKVHGHWRRSLSAKAATA